MTPVANAQVDPVRFASSVALPLGQSGEWITDAKGRVVVLHGENVVNKNAPFYPQALGFDDDDADLLAQQGFNAVRLGFFWSSIEPEQGIYDDNYLEKIRQTVSRLAARGIVTLVEAHSDIWGTRFGGEGAPEWATLDNGQSNPSEMHGQIYLNMMANPAVKAAFSNFFDNAEGPNGTGIMDSYAAMWKHVAARLANTPGLIGYGLINQPSPGKSVAACLADHCPQEAFDKLDELNQKVGAAIRSVDDKTTIQVSSYFPGSYGARIGIAKPTFGNSQFGLNSYCIAGALVAAPFPACASQYESTYSQVRDFTKRAGIPAVINEFGSTADTEVVRGVADLADKNMLSWFHWSYHGKDTTNFSNDVTGQSIVEDASLPLTKENVNEPLLDALARPYPWLTSGTPQHWDFDESTRTFHYVYKTMRASANGAWPSGAITEIRVPDRVYPNGYEAVVEGGHALNGAGPVLAVVADGVTDQVSVQIRSRSGA
ncbi:cellulase family glycosylhydrolase [Mycobacteroides abscessus]|uniref:cellulase family glycosylhydrolase n=1 Tax=Mycobacteroides abscessus TaxID=36809 RepID=UPI0013143A88|nr:cellulase family glycosylhydrolase [Mycobacteroides abscessus]